MSDTNLVIVAGLGEVGGPLFRILGRSYSCLSVDIEPVESLGPCSVLHICYPFQIADFVGTTAAYIRKYEPGLIIINSTVSPGTTAKISAVAGATVAYSPVRGKHAKMEQDMLFYRKFVGADNPAAVAQARTHFEGAGFKTAAFPNATAGEVAKLIETTWLGILVGWAQEVERIAGRYDATYEDLNAFIAEVAFLPHDVFPGLIEGHCVMPNIALLRSVMRSDFLDAVVNSNDFKRSGATRSTLTGKTND
ncbi:MAG: hypothetical protein ABSE51_18190 [Terracidiphilus sp.]